MREAAPDDDGLQVDVEPRGDQRLVAAGDDDQFVAELIVRATPAANFLAKRAFLRFGHLLDDQHLEVQVLGGPDGVLLQGARIDREHVRVVHPRGVDLAAAVRLGGQSAIDARNGVGELVVVAGHELALHLGELRCAGVGPVGLQRGQGGQQALAYADVLVLQVAGGGRAGKPIGRLVQSAPGVASELPRTVVGVLRIS